MRSGQISNLFIDLRSSIFFLFIWVQVVMILFWPRGDFTKWDTKLKRRFFVVFILFLPVGAVTGMIINERICDTTTYTTVVLALNMLLVAGFLTGVYIVGVIIHKKYLEKILLSEK